MQQITSFPTVPAPAGRAVTPKGAPTQHGQASAFRGMLMEALLGAQAPQTAPVSGGLMPAGAALQASLLAQAGADPHLPRVGSLTAEGQVKGALARLLMGQVPEGRAAAEEAVPWAAISRPLDFPAEQGEQTAPFFATSLAALAVLAEMAADPAQPEEVPAEGAPVSPEAVLLAAAMVQQQTGGQAAPAQAAPAGDAQPLAGQMATDLPEGDPALERFVRQAQTALRGTEEGAAEPAQAREGARFDDLVRLVAGQGETDPQSRTQGEARPRTQGEAPTQGEAQLQPQSDSRAPSPPQADQPPPAGAPQAQPRRPGGRPELPPQAPERPEAPVRPETGKAEEPQPVNPGTQPRQTLEATLEAAEPQEAPRQAPMEPEQVVRQVARFLKVSLESNRSEVRFALHPEHLGTVTVKLVVQEGAVRATVSAQDAAVKAALEANLDSLRGRLADQGLRVEQVQVTIGGDALFGQSQHSHQGQQQRQPQQPSQAPWQSRREAPAKEETLEPRPAQPLQTGRLIGKGTRLNSLA